MVLLVWWFVDLFVALILTAGLLLYNSVVVFLWCCFYFVCFCGLFECWFSIFGCLFIWILRLILMLVVVFGY